MAKNQFESKWKHGLQWKLKITSMKNERDAARDIMIEKREKVRSLSQQIGDEERKFWEWLK